MASRHSMGKALSNGRTNVDSSNKCIWKSRYRIDWQAPWASSVSAQQKLVDVFLNQSRIRMVN